MANKIKVCVALTSKNTTTTPNWAKNAQVYYKYSFMGLWAYHRAKYAMYTHGFVAGAGLCGKRKVINIWHGMPIKKIGIMDGKKKNMPLFDYTIADNLFFSDIMAKSFGVTKDRVLINKNPRIDILLRGAVSKKKYGIEERVRIAVWMPTYRKSIAGDVRSDGDVDADIFKGGVDFSSINNAFAEKNIVCFVKPHPMSGVIVDDLKNFSNIIFISDEILVRRYGGSTYEILSVADLLITDVSSVYLDYIVLERDVIIYCPDFEEYKRSRGFSFEVENIIHQKVCKNLTDLICEINSLDVGKMDFVLRRCEGESETKKLFRQIGIM